MNKIGFDNDKYLSMQSEHIRARTLHSKYRPHCFDNAVVRCFFGGKNHTFGS